MKNAIARTVGSVILAILCGACSLHLNERGSQLGAGFAMAALTELRSDSARAALRGLSDATIAAAAESYAREVQPRLDTTIGRATKNGEAFLRHATDSLLSSVKGPLAEAVVDAAGVTTRRVGDEGSRQVAQLIRDASLALERDLVPVLVRSSREAASDAARAAGEAAFANSGPRIRLLIDSVVASAVRVGLQEGNKRILSSPVWRTAVAIAVGFFVSLLLIGGAWIWYDRQRARRALAVVTQAVTEAHDVQLPTRIRALARDRKTGSYLREFEPNDAQQN